MKKILVTSLVALSLTSFSLNALADGFYFGGGYGRTRIRTSSDDFLNSPTVDKSSRGGQGFIGYAFNNSYGIEAAYRQFGRFDVQGATGGSIRPYAAGASLFAMIPAGNFGFGGSAGLYSLHYSTSSSINYATGKTAPGTGLAYGYGAYAQYGFVSNAAVRLAWDGIIERHRGNSVRTNPGMLTLNLVINLGGGNVGDNNNYLPTN